MKKILITGKESYIGKSLKDWLLKHPTEYLVDEVDTLNGEWKKVDFSKYDCIYHVAGIAHRKDAPDSLYEMVNHVLAVDVAKKAIASGVQQFIFMSSGAVYTQNDKNHKTIHVDVQTKLEPNTAYGKSKLKAEQDILSIAKGSAMKIAILRPPMVYGKGAKGNYNGLSKIAKISPFFPKIRNQRSMIYIDNLCEFIRLAIDNEISGIFLPQNKEYVVTYELVQEIAKVHAKQILITGMFNWVVYFFSYLINAVNKAFGSYTYTHYHYFDDKYQVIDFLESIRISEDIRDGQ